MPKAGRKKGSKNVLYKYCVIDEDSGEKKLFRSTKEMADYYDCTDITMRNTIKDKQRGVGRNSKIGIKLMHKQIKEIPKEDRIFTRVLGNNFKANNYESNKDAFIDFYKKYISSSNRDNPPEG